MNVLARLYLVLAGICSLTLVASAESGTWLCREGVGTSPANPALWTDAANWVDGVIPEGKAATADFRVGESTRTVWIKIPDGETVTLTYLECSIKNVGVRIFGGAIKVVDENNYNHARFRISDNNGIDSSPWATVYSDVVCEGSNLLRVNVFSLGGALRFDPGATLTASYVPLFYMDRYAESGEERRNAFGTLNRIEINNTMVVQVPGLTEDTTGTWRACPGSRLLERVSGTAGFGLQPGQHVSGAGIAAGSYIKYIYADDFIELSEAPTVGETTEISCAFARHAPKLSHTFGYASASGQIQTGRTTEENAFTVTINELRSAADGSALLHDYRGSLYYSDKNTIDRFPGPGVVELKDLSSFNGELQVRGSHYRFLPPTEGATETLLTALGNSSSYPSFTRGRLDVVEGLTLTINDVKSWQGEYYKAGAGTAIFKTSLSAMSLLRVEEGLAVLDPSDPTARISMLAVQAGGTFRLAEGRTLRAAKLKVNAGGTLEYDDASKLTYDEIAVVPGAIIKVGEGKTLTFSAETFPAGTIFAGPGELTGLPSNQAGNYNFIEGIRFSAGGPAENITFETPSAEMPTRVSPAFWVTAKEESSVVTDANGTVLRWNDWRGTAAAGYHFATNCGTLTVPQGTYPRFNGECIQVRHNNDVMRNPTSVADVGALVWDAPITGIKSVYLVMHNGYDGQNGGGALLGATERLAGCDFARSATGGWYSDRFDSTKASANVLNAPFYINGQVPPAIQVGQTIYRNVMMTFANSEQVVECHPLGDGASADCWGYQHLLPSNYGAWLGECIIFTNELTRTEQVQVTNYLMAKWFGSKAMTGPVIPESQCVKELGGSTVSIDAGAALLAETVRVPKGTLKKTGDGTLYLEDVQAAALAVADGEVVITSYDAADAANLPSDAVLHLDATDDASFTGLEVVDGVEQVDKWYDTDRGASAPIYLYRPAAAQKKPTRVMESTAFVRPMKVVDYGPLKTSKDEGATKDASQWWFTSAECCAHGFTTTGSSIAKVEGVTAAAGVWGSKYGGHQLLGGWNNAGEGLSREQEPGSQVAENIAHPILGKVYTDTRWDGKTSLAYGTFCLKNGEEVVPGQEGLSGTWDVVSLRTDYAKQVVASSIAGYGNRSKTGGIQLGELIFYTRDITEDEIRRVDAYLNHKWFGRPVPSRYAPAEIGVLNVAAGATVRTTGGGPLKVGSISGGGTIEGRVVFAGETPVIDVVVAEDGSVDCVTLASSQVLDGGTIRLSGAVKKLKSGAVDVLHAAGIVPTGVWTLEFADGAEDANLALKVREGCVRLVAAKGLVLIFK